MKRITIFTVFLVLTAATAAAAPNLNIDTVSTDPQPVKPGDTATLYVSVQNDADDKAENLRVTYNGHRLFNLLQPDDRVTTRSLLGGREDLTLKYDVTVPENAPQGTYSLPFTLEAGNTRGTVNKEVSVEIKPETPSLDLTDVTVSPSPLRPGQQAQVSLSLVNQGNRAIENIDVSMDTTNTGLLPIGETNTKSVGQILAGESTTTAFQVTSRPGSETALYEIPFTVSYDDTSGEPVEKTVETGIRIQAEPKFITTVRDTDITTTSREAEISVSVINRGLAKMKLAQAQLLEDDSYVLEDTDSYYLGDIESDDFDVISFNAQAQNDTLSIPVQLTYRTAFNEERTVTRTATYTLPEGQTSSNITLYVVIAVLLAGGVWWYRRRS